MPIPAPTTAPARATPYSCHRFCLPTPHTHLVHICTPHDCLPPLFPCSLFTFGAPLPPLALPPTPAPVGLGRHSGPRAHAHLAPPRIYPAHPVGRCTHTTAQCRHCPRWGPVPVQWTHPLPHQHCCWTSAAPRLPPGVGVRIPDQDDWHYIVNCRPDPHLLPFVLLCPPPHAGLPAGGRPHMQYRPTTEVARQGMHCMPPPSPSLGPRCHTPTPVGPFGALVVPCQVWDPLLHCHPTPALTQLCPHVGPLPRTERQYVTGRWRDAVAGTTHIYPTILAFRHSLANSAPRLVDNADSPTAWLDSWIALFRLLRFPHTFAGDANLTDLVRWMAFFSSSPGLTWIARGDRFVTRIQFPTRCPPYLQTH